MSEVEEELVDMQGPSAHFSQLGSIREVSLSQLRDHIKQVMIPLLIKAFRYQMDLIPSARAALQSDEIADSSLKEAYEQLRILDHDLDNLQLWCHSCRAQIDRALNLPEEEKKNISAIPDSTIHPDLFKSFVAALQGASCVKTEEPSFKAWWKTFLRRKRE